MCMPCTLDPRSNPYLLRVLEPAPIEVGQNTNQTQSRQTDEIQEDVVSSSDPADTSSIADDEDNFIDRSSNFGLVLRIIIIGILLIMCLHQQQQQTNLYNQSIDKYEADRFQMEMKNTLHRRSYGRKIIQSNERDSHRDTRHRDRNREAALAHALDSYNVSVDSELGVKMKVAYDIMRPNPTCNSNKVEIL